MDTDRYVDKYIYIYIDRQVQMDRSRYTDRQVEKRYRWIDLDRQINKWKDRYRWKDLDRQKDRLIDWLIDIDGQADIDRQIDIDIQIQIDRQIVDR